MATTIKNATLYNDYNYNVEDYRDAYLDHCDANGIDVEDEVPMEFIQNMLDDEWFNLLYDILENNPYNEDCVVLGSLGLWNGKKQIVPTREKALVDAIKNCCRGCDYNRIDIVDGHIEVKSVHHDGTNVFEIHVLNELGRKSIYPDLTKSCYYRKIKNDFWQ
jgi:hypothetical protein